MSMSDPVDAPPQGPYAAAADTYRRAGWAGVLPLPHGQKAPVPAGWTGRDGQWPSGADIYAWTEDHPGGNIALRLPPNVLGVDCDHYDGKPGGLVLASLEQQLGALPPTWRTTSRDDGVSGIRLYRIPEGLRWPGVLGPGIETIRTEHRYAVCWPSIHPNGGTYRWITPNGATALGVVPTPDDLPALPGAWVEHFTRGEIATDQPRANLTDSAARQWIEARDAGIAPPCRAMTTALARSLADLTTGTSRHDAALSGTNRLVWLVGEGHVGGPDALARLRSAFLTATAGDRAEGDADAEWERMVAGAVRMAAAANPNPSPDPCITFGGLMLPRKETTCAQTATAPTGNGPPPLPASSNSTSASAASVAGTSSTSVSTTGDPTTTSADTDELERTSWWPRNLEPVLTGEHVEPEPTFLTRDDGHSLFYAGKVNGIIGPSESGKTWIALQAVVAAVNDQQRVTILDFEDSATGLTSRLLALGLTAAHIRGHVAYINPDEPFAPYQPTGRDITEHLTDWAPQLVILDGFNAAMTLQGLDLMSNKDATHFAQTILKPIAGAGACVVYIDHTPKSKENASAGGIGAQAKRAMTTGCTLKVDPIKPFGKGQEGRLRVYVDKDRPGHVRGASLPSNGTHWAADVTLSPREDGIRIAVCTPDGFDADQGAYEFRPTGYMERVSNWLVDNPGAGRNDITKGVTGKAQVVREALRILIEEGWVVVDRQGQRHLHTVARAYTEAAELVVDLPVDMPSDSKSSRFELESPANLPVGGRSDNNSCSQLGQNGHDPTGFLGSTGVPLGSGTRLEELGSRVPTGGRSPQVPEPSYHPSDPALGSRPEGRIVWRAIEGQMRRVDLESGEVFP